MVLKNHRAALVYFDSLRVSGEWLLTLVVMSFDASD